MLVVRRRRRRKPLYLYLSERPEGCRHVRLDHCRNPVSLPALYMRARHCKICGAERTLRGSLGRGSLVRVGLPVFSYSVDCAGAVAPTRRSSRPSPPGRPTLNRSTAPKQADGRASGHRGPCEFMLLKSQTAMRSAIGNRSSLFQRGRTNGEENNHRTCCRRSHRRRSGRVCERRVEQNTRSAA